MAWSHRLSIRVRVTAWATLAAVALFASGAALLYRDLSNQLTDAVNFELSLRLDALEDAIAGSSTAAVSRAQAERPDGTVVRPAGSQPLLTPREAARASTQTIMIDRPVPGVGEHARLMARPLVRPGTSGPLIGVAATTTRPLVVARSNLLGSLSTAGPALAVVVGIATWALAGAVLRPVRRMAHDAATTSMRGSGERLGQPPGRDEIAELGRTLNAMLDRIEEAVAHERDFLDDAAHELRTPLAVLRGELELASLSPDDAEAVESSLRSALEETDRLARLTTDLLTLARADAGQLVPRAVTVDIGPIVSNAASRIAFADVIALDLDCDTALATVDPDWVTQITTNLVANAARYATSKVLVTVRAMDGRVEVRCADDGPGFAPELVPIVFERFTRGTEARGRAGPATGVGLGLAITASLVLTLGGTISLDRDGPLAGACLTVRFPRTGYLDSHDPLISAAPPSEGDNPSTSPG